MPVPNQPIFRNNAMKHYMQSREKTTLLRFASLPLALFLWALLASLLIMGIVAWYNEIPMYTTGPGVVLPEEQSSRYKDNDAIAAVFLPANAISRAHVGAPVQVRFNASDDPLQGRVLEIEPAMSPYVVFRRYGLDGDYIRLVTQPSVVVIVKLETVSSSMYAGSMLSADVEVGSQRIISLLPGLGSLFGK